jgi:hypothetical protein
MGFCLWEFHAKSPPTLLYLQIHYLSSLKYFFRNQRAAFTKLIIIGTSISGPITVANASFDANPKTATATAIANSKLLLAAVKERDVVLLKQVQSLLR